MNNENVGMDEFSSALNSGDVAKNMIQEFNDAIHRLAQTKDSLESEVVALKDKLSNLKKEIGVMETDIGQIRDVSDIAMAAKASEEEKQDAIQKNQELRSYLHSAADKIKSLDMQFAQEHNEVKRLLNRIKLLETEKAALIRERDGFGKKISDMSNIIREQEFKIKNLSLKLEAEAEDKKHLENELASTKKSMHDIQSSMDKIKTKMRISHLNEPVHV